MRGRKRTWALLVHARRRVAESPGVNMVAADLCLFRVVHQTALRPGHCLLFTKGTCDGIMKPEVLLLLISLASSINTRAHTHTTTCIHMHSPHSV